MSIAVWPEDSLPIIEFRIKPRICLLSEGETICRDELELSWSSSSRRSLCLYRSDHGDTPLKCWENSFRGEHHIEISASQNVNFQLKEINNEKLLVSTAFEVVQDNTQYRQRRRNAWSFF